MECDTLVGQAEFGVDADLIVRLLASRYDIRAEVRMVGGLFGIFSERVNPDRLGVLMNYTAGALDTLALQSGRPVIKQNGTADTE